MSTTHKIATVEVAPNGKPVMRRESVPTIYAATVWALHEQEVEVCDDDGPDPTDRGWITVKGYVLTHTPSGLKSGFFERLEPAVEAVNALSVELGEWAHKAPKGRLDSRYWRSQSKCLSTIKRIVDSATQGGAS